MSEIQASHNPDEVAKWQNVADTMHTWHPGLQSHAKRIIEERRLPVDLSKHEAQSGHDVSVSQVEQQTDKITIDRGEIRPHSFSNGETEIILQRHGKYIRDKDDPNVGKLTPEAVQLETESALHYFSELIAQVPEDERNGINVFFVASDTSYAGGGQRSHETALIAQKVAEQLFQEKGIPAENILNITPDLEDEPMAMPELREPQFIDETPEFFFYLRDKFGGMGPDFWNAFEGDTEKETRLAMGAEGPDEISDRLKDALQSFARWSHGFHQQEPNNRLIIWVGTHYDTISPYVKREVLHQGKETSVMVDYGGGIAIDISRDNQAITTIGEKSYPIKL